VILELISVLVPVPVVSLAELLKVPAEKLLSSRHCCSEISEFFDLLRIAGSNEPDVRFSPDSEFSGFTKNLPSDLLRDVEDSFICGFCFSRKDPPSGGPPSGGS
jgi:hypothetical protein